MAEIDERRRTAFHEAGHAVADVRGEFIPTHVTIEPNDSRLGASGSAYGWDDTESARKFLVSLCAGLAADLELGGDEESARGGANNDLERAEEILEHLAEGTLETWIDAARLFVREPNNWKAIELVAEELLDRGRMLGEEVEILVELADGAVTEDEAARALGIARMMAERRA